MNIATAGHVDHGKTSLVRALTNVDTDRLAEEKRRGLSIDLGFAYADFDTDAPVGFVDVPGHEHFVRNMLAGVTSIDLALLVIAADDGPMPQTREHLAILQTLGVPRAVVALSKIDRVSPQRLAQVHIEVQQLLDAGPFRDAPVFPLVATDGTGGIGVSALRQHLVEAARSHLAHAAQGAGFRLAVDRSFLIDGAGRVVTGAVLAGKLRVGDAVVVSPAGTAARVRSLHAQGQAADGAIAGQRCALNLAGNNLRQAAPSRGDWIVAPALHVPTQCFDTEYSQLADAPYALAARSGLQLHIGAAVIGVRVLPLGRSPDCVVSPTHTIAAGESGYLHVLSDQPIAALHGDRFILRDAARQQTIGGGRVLDPFAVARIRDRTVRLARMAAFALPTPTTALQALLEQSIGGIDIDQLAIAWNLDAQALAQLLDDLPDHRIVQAGRGAARRLLGEVHWQSARAHVLAALAAHHDEAPDSLGPTEPALLAQLQRQQRGRSRALLQVALHGLIDEDSVQRTGLRVRLTTHTPVLGGADEQLLQRITAALQAAGLRAPIVGELAVQLSAELPTLLAFLQRVSEMGRLLQVAPNRYYLPETMTELTALAAQLAAESDAGGFDTTTFKDRSGIGRNLSVQVLEFMDHAGLTRFDGKQRRPIDPTQAPA